MERFIAKVILIVFTLFLGITLLSMVLYTFQGSSESESLKDNKEIKKVPTYVIVHDVKIPIEEYQKAQQTKVKTTPSNFTKDQVQQKQKVEQISKTSLGVAIIRSAEKASQRYGIDRNLILAISLTESGWDPQAKNGNSYGLMQLSTNTTASKECNNLYHIECNILASTKHYAGLHAKYKGNTRLALAAYNAGGGSVDHSLKNTGDIPSSTLHYVKKVNQYKQIFNLLQKV